MPREGTHEEAWILLPSFFLTRTYAAPLGRVHRSSLSTSAASASAPINGVPLLDDDPADAIRSASATSASAISS
jgi:hypothetical protein